MKLQTYYKIFYVSEDGLLKVPKTSYDDSCPLFCSQYNTIEEAQKDIVENGVAWREYVIIPIYSAIDL